MSNRKRIKTRIKAFDKRRFADELEGTTQNDFLAGAVYEFLDGEVSEEYYDNIQRRRELIGKQAELESREVHLEERIEQLQNELESVREEKEEVNEEIDEIESELAEADENSESRSTQDSNVEDVAYDILVEYVQHPDEYDDGMVYLMGTISDAALRAGLDDPEEMMEVVQKEAQPATEAENVDAEMIEKAFRSDEKVKTLSPIAVDKVRKAVAEHVLDDDDYDDENVERDPMDLLSK